MINQKYVLNPTVNWLLSEGQLTAELPFYGMKISSNSKLKEICDLINETGSFSPSENDLGLDKNLISFLVDNYLLLNEKDYEYMQFGLTKMSNISAGKHISLSELYKDSESGDIVILHAPIELSQSYSVSVAAGGQRVREHLHNSLKNRPISISSADEIIIDFDLERQINLSDVRIKDLGDIIFYPELESPSIIGKRTKKVIDSVLKKGCYPVILGGDHSITFYILESVRTNIESFGIIHFDAHHDFYSSGKARNINDSTVNHANVFHHISKMGEVKVIHQIGLRDIYKVSETSQSQKLGDRIHFVGCRSAEKKPVEKILENIDPNIPYYVTFDVDVLDSGKGDGTATPLLGGLSYWRAFELMQEILSTYKIIGLDFVEIGGKTTSAYSTADFAARMIMLFAFSIRPTKPLSTYIYS